MDSTRLTRVSPSSASLVLVGGIRDGGWPPLNSLVRLLPSLVPPAPLERCWPSEIRIQGLSVIRAPFVSHSGMPIVASKSGMYLRRNLVANKSRYVESPDGRRLALQQIFAAGLTVVRQGILRTYSYLLRGFYEGTYQILMQRSAFPSETRKVRGSLTDPGF